jgi:hypothetical protein
MAQTQDETNNAHVQKTLLKQKLPNMSFETMRKHEKTLSQLGYTRSRTR